MALTMEDNQKSEFKDAISIHLNVFVREIDVVSVSIAVDSGSSMRKSRIKISGASNVNRLA